MPEYANKHRDVYGKGIGREGSEKLSSCRLARHREEIRKGQNSEGWHTPSKTTGGGKKG
jgi:hypothetical protein